MNLNKRELSEHVEFESQTYYAAFAAELEACAQPMWGLLTHCKVKVSPISLLNVMQIMLRLFDIQVLGTGTEKDYTTNHCLFAGDTGIHQDGGALLLRDSADLV